MLSEQPETTITLKELLIKIKGWFFLLLKRWKLLLVLACIGAALGGWWSKSKKTLYVAECTFVFDDGSSNKVGGLASLGLGGAASSAGLFDEKDNIIWLYSSRYLLQKTLLTNVNRNGKDILLVNWFLSISGVEKQLQKNPELLKLGKFESGMNLDSLNVQQNSIINDCIGHIKKRYLKILEAEKTQNIITVRVTSEDELFSKLFADNLVKNVNDFYIQTKTKKTQEEVISLQNKADSIRGILNNSMYAAAAAIDETPMANPNLQTLKVKSQKKQVDIQVSTTIYSELIKSLESTKSSLAKEKPLLQVIDAPELPLDIIKPSLLISAILGAILFVSLGTAVIVLRAFWQKIMR